MERQSDHLIHDLQTFVGGCRSLPGGLHLGHIYGCMLGVPRSVTLYFVLSDCLTEGMGTEASIVDVAADSLAVGSFMNLDIKPVRESILRPQLSNLFQCLLSGSNFRLLAEAHPPKAQIKNSGFAGTVDEFLFPIHQAAYLLGLGCSIACYNDDNSRYVDLTRKIARRTNEICGLTLNSQIALLAKDPPRLRSWDGRRMAKTYNNTLHVRSSSSEIQRFAERLVGRASGGDPGFDTSGQSELERLYLSTFGSRLFQSSALGRERIGILVQALTEWCRNVELCQRTPDEVIECLHSSEAHAIERIEFELERAGVVRKL